MVQLPAALGRAGVEQPLPRASGEMGSASVYTLLLVPRRRPDPPHLAPSRRPAVEARPVEHEPARPGMYDIAPCWFRPDRPVSDGGGHGHEQ